MNNLKKSTDKLVKEIKHCQSEQDRERKIDNMRWNHPNKIVRCWWRFYMTREF